jgi:hypothetical protein
MNHSRSQMRAAKREKYERGHRSAFRRDFPLRRLFEACSVGVLLLLKESLNSLPRRLAGQDRLQNQSVTVVTDDPPFEQCQISFRSHGRCDH